MPARSPTVMRTGLHRGGGDALIGSAPAAVRDVI